MRIALPAPVVQACLWSRHVCGLGCRNLGLRFRARVPSSRFRDWVSRFAFPVSNLTLCAPQIRRFDSSLASDVGILTHTHTHTHVHTHMYTHTHTHTHVRIHVCIHVFVRVCVCVYMCVCVCVRACLRAYAHIEREIHTCTDIHV